MSVVPISIIIPTRNEYLNLGRCLEQLKGWADEILVVDSQSADGTIELAESYGTKVIQFYYNGGWPKKRQWTLDTYPIKNEWILLLDADEILQEPTKEEISRAIKNDQYNGFWLRFPMYFLGRQLRYGDSELWKLFLFRKGHGRYEKRLEMQNCSMSDIEVHEHVIVDGKVGYLKSPVKHENINSLNRYIQKHNEYSNWEASIYYTGRMGELKPDIWGNQAQRRRRLKQLLIHFPGSPVIYFFYLYIFKLGILDGVPGLIFCCLSAIQLFHVKAKIYELKIKDGNFNRPTSAKEMK